MDASGCQCGDSQPSKDTLAVAPRAAEKASRMTENDATAKTPPDEDGESAVINCLYKQAANDTVTWAVVNDESKQTDEVSVNVGASADLSLKALSQSYLECCFPAPNLVVDGMQYVASQPVAPALAFAPSLPKQPTSVRQEDTSPQPPDVVIGRSAMVECDLRQKGKDPADVALPLCEIGSDRNAVSECGSKYIGKLAASKIDSALTDSKHMSAALFSRCDSILTDTATASICGSKRSQRASGSTMVPSDLEVSQCSQESRFAAQRIRVVDGVQSEASKPSVDASTVQEQPLGAARDTCLPIVLRDADGTQSQSAIVKYCPRPSNNGTYSMGTASMAVGSVGSRRTDTESRYNSKQTGAFSFFKFDSRLSDPLSIFKQDSKHSDKVTIRAATLESTCELKPSSSDSGASSNIRTKSLKDADNLGHRVRSGAKDIDNQVMNIVSFKGCEDLLRGSRLSVVMRDRARIFSDSSGSAATYKLSKPTTIIDAFISHNWCVPRWQKFLCLSLQFNLKIALFLTYVACTPLFVLSCLGYVPTTHPSFAYYPRSWYFRLILFPILMVILLFYRDIVRIFPIRDPIVFLDKTCIHQEDKKIQRQGIEKLGAFLCYSKTMVICYTDIYLNKLWTVYEVASFMTLQSVEQMRVVPVNFPVVYLLSLSFIYIAGAFALWPELTVGFYFTGRICLFLFCYCIIAVFRRWCRSKLDIYRKVASFSARDCICFCEDDRPVVYANIAALMRATQDIGKDATEEAALACFDNLVRNHLSGALISSVGKYSMRYEHAVAVGIGLLAPVCDQLAGFAHGMPVRYFVNYALWYLVTSCAVVPGAFIGFSAWADTCLRFTGWQEYVYLALGLIAVFLPTTIMTGVLDLLEIWSNQSDVGMVFFFSFFILTTALARNTMNASPCCIKVCGSRFGHVPRNLEELEDMQQKKEPTDPGNVNAQSPQVCEADEKFAETPKRCVL